MKGLELWVMGYLLNSIWQVPLVFAAAWIAARMLRAAGPRAEHRVWVGALLLEAVVPAFHAPSLGIFEWVRRLLPWGLASGGGGGVVRVLIGAGSQATAEVMRVPRAVLIGALVIYAGCLVYFAGRLAWGVWRTVAMRRASEQVTLAGEAARIWDRCLGFSGLEDDAVAIEVSPMTPGPVTMGVVQQVLLVPPGFLERVGEGELEAALAHEFAHMRRRDFAKNLVYEMVSLPVSYHPLLWLTRLWVAESREMVCDGIAAEAVAGRERYLRCLLRLASMLSDRAPVRVLHAIGIFDANIFERRVMNLTRRDVRVSGVRRVAIAVACAAIGAVTCVSAMALRMEVSAATVQSDDAKGKSAAPNALSVDPGVMAGSIVSKVMPVYPADAKANKDTVNGAVILSVVVDKEGVAKIVKVKKSLRGDYDQSAVDAVSQWRWKPFLLNGEPTEVKTTITINYTLAE
jgi:TonB family protein